MKISNEQITKVLQNYNQKGVQQKTELEKKDKNDKLSLSTEVKEIQLAKEGLASQELPREPKVDQLKTAIKSGNYDVSGAEVAAKMLEQVTIDELI